MRKLALALALLAVVALCGACSMKVTPAPGQAPLRLAPGAKFNVGEITDRTGFKFAEGDEDAFVLTEAMSRALQKALAAAFLEGGPMTVKVDLTGYAPGNAFARWLLPGAGATKLDVLVVVLDETGLETGRFTAERSIGFGGAYTAGAYKYVFDEVATAVAGHLAASLGQSGQAAGTTPPAAAAVGAAAPGTAPEAGQTAVLKILATIAVTSLDGAPVHWKATGTGAWAEVSVPAGRRELVLDYSRRVPAQGAGIPAAAALDGEHYRNGILIDYDFRPGRVYEMVAAEGPEARGFAGMFEDLLGSMADSASRRLQIGIRDVTDGAGEFTWVETRGAPGYETAEPPPDVPAPPAAPKPGPVQ